MLDKKLQLKENQTIACINNPIKLDLTAAQAAPDAADAVLVFAVNESELRQYLTTLKTAMAASKLTWVAYPKAKQLNTDINRDVVRNVVNQNGLDPVRQVVLDDTWSALRLKLLESSFAITITTGPDTDRLSAGFNQSTCHHTDSASDDGEQYEPVTHDQPARQSTYGQPNAYRYANNLSGIWAT